MIKISLVYCRCEIYAHPCLQT